MEAHSDMMENPIYMPLFDNTIHIAVQQTHINDTPNCKLQDIIDNIFFFLEKSVLHFNVG